MKKLKQLFARCPLLFTVGWDKVVKASFVTPGMEKNNKRGKGYCFFGLMKWFIEFFKHPKHNDISFTLPKKKEEKK